MNNPRLLFTILVAIFRSQDQGDDGADFRPFRKTVAPVTVWFRINETLTEIERAPERQAIYLSSVRQGFWD